MTSNHQTVDESTNSSSNSGSANVDVYFEATPNPQTMKFIVSKAVVDAPVNFEQPLDAGRSPLAAKLFGFPWCDGVFLGPHFVSVTKQDWVDWEVLAEPLSQIIKEHMQSNEPVIHPEAAVANLESDSDTDDVKLIKSIIQTEIRPAVAMDGGDIVFNKYEEGIVYVYMQGACAGCPSSSITLKQGIETRLKNALPSIKEVVAS